MKLSSSRVQVTLHLVLYLLIGIAWAIYLHFFPFGPNSQEIPDSGSYLTYFDAQSGSNSTIYRTIGYPIVLSVLKALSSFLHANRYALVYVAQMIMTLVVLYLCLTILMRYFPWWVLSLFTLLVGLNPSMPIYTYLISSEMTFLFWIGISVFAIHQFTASRQNRYLHAGLAALCLATLTRPGLYYFTAAVLMILMVYHLGYQKKVKPAMVTLGIFCISLISGQFLFYQKHGLFTLSMIDQITMHRYFRNAVEAETKGTDYETLLSINDSLDARQWPMIYHEHQLRPLSQYYQSALRKTLNGHYRTAAKVYVASILSNIHNGNSYVQTPVNKNKTSMVFNLSRIVNVIAGGLLILQLLGCFWLAYRKQYPILIFFIVAYATYTVLSSGISFWQGDRFNIVWIPFVVFSSFLFFSRPFLNGRSSFGASSRS